MEIKFWHQSRSILNSVEEKKKKKKKRKIICTCPNQHLSISMHLQFFIKIHQLVHKILSINEISTSTIKVITLLKMNEKYCSVIQIYILSISMHIQNLIEIHKITHKILSINKILTSIKDHNSVKTLTKITWISYNMNLVYINAYTKFYENSSIWSEDIDEKHIFTSIKGHASVVNKRI